jgi:hypothetical protein
MLLKGRKLPAAKSGIMLIVIATAIPPDLGRLNAISHGPLSARSTAGPIRHRPHRGAQAA